MILSEILNLIKTSETFKTIPIYQFDIPVANSKVTRCLVYEFTPFSDNGTVRQDLFSVMVKSKNNGEAISLGEKLNALLVTVGDKGLTDHIKQCSQEGGGSFYNEETKLHTIQKEYSLTSDARRK